MTRLVALAFAVLVAAATHATAHPLAPGLLEVREQADSVADVVWKTPVLQPAGEALVPMLPDDCRPLGPPGLERDDTRLVQRWRVRCPAGLVGRTLGMRGIDAAKTATLVRVALADGRVVTQLLTADRPTFVVPPRPALDAVVREYVALGVEHLVSGFDHLLFVLGLVLLIERRRTLVLTVTAFTVGHSLTLSLAVLGLIAVPTAPIEVAIAASLVVLAAELAASECGHPGLLSRRPWLMALAFGLLHGFGFAGALAEVGVPADEIPLALLSFNVGIELGQLACVALVLAVLSALRRVTLVVPSRLRQSPAYGIGGIAAFWCLERLEPIVQALAR